jgi:hypothetical protein
MFDRVIRKACAPAFMPLGTFTSCSVSLSGSEITQGPLPEFRRCFGEKNEHASITALRCNSHLGYSALKDVSPTSMALSLLET